MIVQELINAVDEFLEIKLYWNINIHLKCVTKYEVGLYARLEAIPAVRNLIGDQLQEEFS